MPKSSYYISLVTPEQFSAKEYHEQAGRMANVFTDVFTDTARIATLTKHAKLSACSTEVDVSTSEAGLMGRAVVDFEASARVPLDKTKLSQMLKALAPWKQCKVEKRAVPVDELEEPGHLVPEDAAVVA